MGYGYNNRDFRGGYKGGSSYRRSFGKKKINKRRLRNRIIIVGTGLVAFTLIIVMISSIFSCICSGCSRPDGSTLDTATKSTGASTKKTTTKTETISFKEPDIKDTSKKTKGTPSGVLYVWNKKAFELFSGTDQTATTYANLMNKAQTTLSGVASVYSMIVPNHTEMGLPARLKNVDGGATTASQADYIKTAYTAMNKKVKYVNAYNEISKHCNDYVYFDSDHHWTGLGAYYAYTAFAKEAKLDALDLSKCEEKKIDGFTGTFTKMVTETLNTDSVHFWEFPYTVTDTVTDKAGNVNTYNTCYYRYAQPGELTYGVFLFGDNPLEVLQSGNEKAKGKIAIVHESYGNAIVPFFTNNYQEVHSIDFRYWKGSLKSYCKKNGIDNLLFVNGVMSSSTAIQIDAMKGIIK